MKKMDLQPAGKISATEYAQEQSMACRIAKWFLVSSCVVAFFLFATASLSASFVAKGSRGSHRKKLSPLPPPAKYSDDTTLWKRPICDDRSSKFTNGLPPVPLILLGGLGGSGSRGYAKMLDNSPHVFIPSINTAFDWPLKDAPEDVKVNGREKLSKKVKYKLRKTYLDLSGITKDTLGGTQNYLLEYDSRKRSEAAVCPAWDSSVRHASEVVASTRRAICYLYERAAALTGPEQSWKEGQRPLAIAAKSGKLSWAIPVLVQAMGDLLGPEAKSESGVEKYLRFVLYTRNGLDMAMSANRAQAITAAGHIDFTQLLSSYDALARTLDHHENPSLGRGIDTNTSLRAVDYDDNIHWKKEVALQYANNKDMKPCVTNGIWWAMLYTHALACLRMLLPNAHTIIRFEDFVTSDRGHRKHSIQDLFERLRIWPESNMSSSQHDQELDKYGSVFDSSEGHYSFDANGDVIHSGPEHTTFNGESHEQKYLATAMSRATAVALLHVASFRDLMVHFRYTIPSDQELLSNPDV